MGLENYFRQVPTLHSRDLCLARGPSDDTAFGARGTPNFGRCGEVETLTPNSSAPVDFSGPKIQQSVAAFVFQCRLKDCWNILMCACSGDDDSERSWSVVQRHAALSWMTANLPSTSQSRTCYLHRFTIITPARPSLRDEFCCMYGQFPWDVLCTCMVIRFNWNLYQDGRHAKA